MAWWHKVHHVDLSMHEDEDEDNDEATNKGSLHHDPY